MNVATFRWLSKAGQPSFRYIAAGGKVMQPCRSISTSLSLRAQKMAPKTKKYSAKVLPYSPPACKITPPLSEAQRASANPRTASWQRFALIGIGLSAFAMSAYMASIYVSLTRDPNSDAGKVPLDVSDRYDIIAKQFDASVDSMESWIGINKLRKKMAAQATGDVCEVSIGTGRNLKFYDWDFQGHNGVGRMGSDYKIKRGKVKSFTAVDKSKEMLEVAHEKFMTEYPGILGIRWVVQDASEPLPNPPVNANERSGNKTNKKFDTIVQTMGLCSTPDPVALLRNLGNSIEPDGRILLLEHGRSTYDWLNKMLDSQAPKHADHFGCWWNKDIEQIVKDSGLEIVEFKRKHFGTTYWIELKPNTKMREGLPAASKAAEASQEETKAEIATTSSQVVEKTQSRSRWW